MRPLLQRAGVCFDLHGKVTEGEGRECCRTTRLENYEVERRLPLSLPKLSLSDTLFH